MLVAMRACLLSFAMLAVAGCRVVEPHSAARSPLAPIALSPDAITLEVFSAPAPHDDAHFDELWQFVDEQPLPADLRVRLAANGMRAGLVGPNIPDSLAAALKVTDRRVEDDQRQLVSMNPDGGVTLRVVHLQIGKRTELSIPRVREETSLLEFVDGQARGKTYHKAECRLALRAFDKSDGRVQLELTPELHHGEFKSRVRGSDGMFLWTQERAKRIFHELKLEPTLAAGEMLLITSRPNRAASAGDHFFTGEAGDKPVAMLWVFRVSQGAPDPVFHDDRPNDEPGPVSSDQEEIAVE
jgi:hypothetical protein